MVGGGGSESSSARFVDQMFVVFVGFETEERESKAVLAGGFSMATAAIATEFGEDGDDLIREVDWENGFEVTNGEWRRRGLVLKADGNRTGPILKGSDSSEAIDAGEGGWGHFVFGEVGNVERIAIGGKGGDDELPSRIGT